MTQAAGLVATLDQPFAVAATVSMALYAVLAIQATLAPGFGGSAASSKPTSHSSRPPSPA